MESSSARTLDAAAGEHPKPYIVNAFSVDVEDYFQVRAFSGVVSRQEWPDFELRVERNTERLLETFDRMDVSATFFVLGWIAERCPALVRTIHAQGHEVASHGHQHQSVTELSPQEFRDDLRQTKQLLEDITGSAVIGYRAPNFSIVRSSLWAIDILIEEGFRYDSSIFPIVHDHYGIRGASRFPGPIDNSQGQLIEFPMSTLQFGRWNLPFSGGGYLRHFPFSFVRWATQRLNDKERQPAVFYIHPWEIDADQPRVDVGFLARLRHYRNIERTEERLLRLFRDFRFTTIREVLGL